MFHHVFLLLYNHEVFLWHSFIIIKCVPVLSCSQLFNKSSEWTPETVILWNISSNIALLSPIFPLKSIAIHHNTLSPEKGWTSTEVQAENSSLTWFDVWSVVSTHSLLHLVDILPFSVYSFSSSCPKTVSRTREVFPTGSTTLLRLQLSRTRDCAHRSRHVGL